MENIPVHATFRMLLGGQHMITSVLMAQFSLSALAGDRVTQPESTDSLVSETSLKKSGMMVFEEGGEDEDG
eukprot:scaffold14144_cov67-Attheya_sp.AAC.1